jgi:thiamine-phosphate pyrophosphorylase
VTHAAPDCQIYIVAAAGPGAAERVQAAAAAVPIACGLIVPAAGESLEAEAARPVVEALKRAGVAALIAENARLARTLRADGVHLFPTRRPEAAYAEAREILGRGAIVGVDPGLSRHDAMSLAEAGVDYVAFGAPAHVQDRVRARVRRDELVAWWAEIFEIPCVALDIETAAEAGRLAHTGADFVGVTLPPDGPVSTIRDFIADVGETVRTAVSAAP